MCSAPETPAASPAGARPYRICCVIPAMRFGGAERVMAGLCNHLAEAGWSVTLLMLAAPDEESAYTLAPEVRVIGLNLLGGGGLAARAASMPARFGGLRRAVRTVKPDLVLSFMDTMNVTVLAATRGLGVPVVVSERTDPAAHRKEIGAFKSLLRRWSYRWATRVIVQAEPYAAFFAFLPRARIAVLPNPVEPANRIVNPGCAGANDRFRLISVGRMDANKGHRLLIDAFARIAPAHPKWDLVVFGDGPERPNLERQVAANGLDGRVELAGTTRDIGEQYLRSHVFALASRYEGIPNTVAEAMAVGLPVVAFDGVPGVRVLVEPEVSGLLAAYDDVTSLAGRLDEAMSDADLRCRIGSAGRERMQAFSPVIVYAQWRRVLETAVGRDRGTLRD